MAGHIGPSVPEFPCGPRGIELRMVRKTLPFFAILAPFALVLAMWLRGPHGLLSAGIGLALGLGNLWASAFLLERAARIGVHMLMAAAMFGFVGRLLMLTGVVAGLRLISVIDVPTLVLVLVATHFVLVIGETVAVTSDDRKRTRTRVLGSGPGLGPVLGRNAAR